MNESIELTLEQQFEIASPSDRIKDLSDDEIRQRLVEIQRQMMLQKNYYDALLKKQWGIGE